MTETDQDWRAVADRYWDDLLELEPILGTEVGDERFDDRLPDPTAAGRRPTGRSSAGPSRRSRPSTGPTSTWWDGRRSTSSRPSPVETSPPWSIAWTGLPRSATCGGRVPSWPTSPLQRAVRPGGPPDTCAAWARSPPTWTPWPRWPPTGPGSARPPWAGGGPLHLPVERLIELAPEDAPPMRPVAESTDGTKDRVATLVRDELWPAGRYLDALRARRPPPGTRSACPPSRTATRCTPPRCCRGPHWPSPPIACTSWAWRTSSGPRGAPGDRAIARFDSPAAAIEAYLAGGNGVAKTRDEVVRLAAGAGPAGLGRRPRAFGRRPSSNWRSAPSRPTARRTRRSPTTRARARTAAGLGSTT